LRSASPRGTFSGTGGSGELGSEDAAGAGGDIGIELFWFLLFFFHC